MFSGKSEVTSAARLSLAVFMLFWLSVPWVAVLFFSDQLLASVAALAIFALINWALVAGERRAGVIPPKIPRRAGADFWKTQRARRREVSQEMQSFSPAQYRARCRRASTPDWLSTIFLVLLLLSFASAIFTYQRL